MYKDDKGGTGGGREEKELRGRGPVAQEVGSNCGGGGEGTWCSRGEVWDGEGAMGGKGVNGHVPGGFDCAMFSQKRR